VNKSAPKKVLIVEDDRSLNRLLVDHLRHMGCEAEGVETGAAAREYLAANTPDLILLDIRLPDCDGFELLVEFSPQVAVIVMTAYGAVDRAVKAVRAGASDYIVKPVGTEALELALERVFTTAELKRDVAYWQSQAQRAADSAIIGSSPQMQELRTMIDLYASAGSTVLIEGESGVGKELVARAIHEASPRSEGRFVPIDCDPTQENQIASELFGHEKGAFPGADTRREGMLGLADRGTIYLNDIAEVPQSLQSKILRVMETGQFRRLGGAEGVPTDLRIIVGTSHDLKQRVQEGHFRSELFFRLSAFSITVPPLRDRVSDVADLSAHFVHTRSFQRGTEREIAPETLEKLQGYGWPGNVRELRNAIERGLIMSKQSPRIEPHHIVLGTGVMDHLPGEDKLDECGVVLRFENEPTLTDLRAAYLRLLFDRHDGNRRQVANVLGISERNTYRLIRKLDNAE
jgi:DNA-binding NtrC family response regulator